DAPGSMIHDSKDADHLIPFLILKQDQVLMSFSSRDFSFVAEDKLQRLFEAFNRFNIKINLMQNAAISFSVCINHPKEKLSLLIDDLNMEFYIRYNDGLELLTIRHFTDEIIDQYLGDRTILIEQRSRRTFQAVYASQSHL
ncbi:MAG: aspartate kinase, partial [Bacteroidota bacterium]